MDENKIILEMIIDVIGDPIRSNDEKLQYAFNCPLCDYGRNKGNMEFNLVNHVYHCWSCDESSETKGSILKFFRHFGNERLVKEYLFHRPHTKTQIVKRAKKVELPEGFIKFSDINLNYPPHRQALEYLRSRDITDDIIQKYNIGLTTKGVFGNRIIFPSYDENDVLNYFIGRTWSNAKPKYLNCDNPKENVIFNQPLINWDEPVFLVEGVLDGIFAGNALVTLGCDLYPLLTKTLYENAKSDIIIAYDADMWKKAKKIYHTINAGKLYGRVKILHLPEDSDVASLRGNIMDYIENVR